MRKLGSTARFAAASQRQMAAALPTHDLQLRIVAIDLERWPRQPRHVPLWCTFEPILPRRPDPAEQGWKETVKFNPGECTSILVDLPPTTGLAPAGVTIPNSPRTAELGVAGAEDVWHCHILEHEEHDMMRPLVVQG